MSPMSVVMLGSSYGSVPVVRGGMLGASLPADAEAITNPDGSAVRATNGLPLYYSQSAKATMTSDGKIVQTDEAKPQNPVLTAAQGALADLIKQAPTATIDILRAQLINKGYSPAVADQAVKNRFSLSANMPWIILGGAALVAVLFMAGSRRRS